MRQGAPLNLVDTNITGPRIYSDASWKNKKIPGQTNAAATGIGIFMEFSQNGHSFTIMIQASTTMTSSVLQAEAKALLLATQFSEKLGIVKPTMLTDNKTLAKAVASRRLDTDHMHWNTRDILARILNSMSNLQAQVFHIKRNVNGVAHNCAHQVLTNSVGPPILSCSSSAHSSPSCPAISILQNVEWLGFVIHAVHCY